MLWTFYCLSIRLCIGLGCFTGLCKIEVELGAKPVVKPACRIPLKLREKLETTLDSLVSKGVLEKVENPQGWVSNLVIVEKSNSQLRVCLDPRDLNKVIKRPPEVLIPTLNDFSEKISGKQVFSVLDLKEGLWQVKLDDKSSDAHSQLHLVVLNF